MPGNLRRKASAVGGDAASCAASPRLRFMTSLAPGVVPPPSTTGELLQLLDVTPMPEHGPDVDIGDATDPGWGRLFGGQLMAQALAAAQKSTSNALATSMHCYFVRPGRIGPFGFVCRRSTLFFNGMS